MYIQQSFPFLLLLVSTNTAFQFVRSPRPPPSTAAKSTVKSSPTHKVRDVTEPTVRRSKWGTDPKESEREYWFDQRIHTLGNIGLSGAFHAAIAPISTKIIDVKAYDGIDIRGLLAQQLAGLVDAQKNIVRPKVVDLCCGVGFSTRALQRAFPWAESVIGVDTSDQMISMAKFITDHERSVAPLFARNMHHSKDNLIRSTAQFFKANAEQTELPSQQFDLVTVMYAFHEAPKKGRSAILREAHRLLKPSGTLAVVDISTEYKPSASMLSGEPYVEDYQKQIHSQLGTAPGFEKPVYQSVVPNHLAMWTLRRSAPLLNLQM